MQVLVLRPPLPYSKYLQAKKIYLQATFEREDKTCWADFNRAFEFITFEAEDKTCWAYFNRPFNRCWASNPL